MERESQRQQSRRPQPLRRPSKCSQPDTNQRQARALPLRTALHCRYFSSVYRSPPRFLAPSQLFAPSGHLPPLSLFFSSFFLSPFISLLSLCTVPLISLALRRVTQRRGDADPCAVIGPSPRRSLDHSPLCLSTCPSPPLGWMPPSISSDRPPVICGLALNVASKWSVRGRMAALSQGSEATPSFRHADTHPSLLDQAANPPSLPSPLLASSVPSPHVRFLFLPAFPSLLPSLPLLRPPCLFLGVLVASSASHYDSVPPSGVVA